MIVTKKKKQEDIVAMLNGRTQVFLIGCGECAATCHTGGQKEIEEMICILEAAGKKVSGFVIPDAPCVASQIRMALAKSIAAVKSCEAILVLSCGLGVQSVKENNRLKQDVFPALDSMFGTVVDAAGNFYEYCSNCGDCLLHKTGTICPLTRCSKGLLNGPCGGVINGKCEVQRDRDCAWVLIHKELANRGSLAKMKAIQKPRDYSKNIRPQSVLNLAKTKV